MTFVSEIEAVAATRLIQWCRATDEKHRVVNVVFLARFVEERVSDNVRSRRFKLCIE